MRNVLGRLGWADRVKIQYGTDLVIDGHMRIEEAAEAGEQVPYTALDLTDAEALELLAIFDPIGAMADTDEDRYRELVNEALQDDDEIRAALLGEDLIEIEHLKASRRLRRGDADATPDMPADPILQVGEMWRLGDHLLVVGDCLDLDLVQQAMKILNAGPAVLCVTDPPYNADYVSRVDKDRANPFGRILNDTMDDDAYGQFLYDAFVTMQTIVRPGGSVYVCIDHDHYAQMETIFKDFYEKQQLIVWDKEHFGMGGMYRNQHELILFGTAGKKADRWNGGHSEHNVWSIRRDPSGTYRHPTQKPVELFERAIRNSSDDGELVVDLFAGSGTAVIGCENLERRCLAFELSERWAEVIVLRWCQFTSDDATRVGDDVSYADLLAARG